jgi:hypothetical protein
MVMAVQCSPTFTHSLTHSLANKSVITLLMTKSKVPSYPFAYR